jgi:hypothetical protein
VLEIEDRRRSSRLCRDMPATWPRRTPCSKAHGQLNRRMSRRDPQRGAGFSRPTRLEEVSRPCCVSPLCSRRRPHPCGSSTTRERLELRRPVRRLPVARLLRRIRSTVDAGGQIYLRANCWPRGLAPLLCLPPLLVRFHCIGVMTVPPPTRAETGRNFLHVRRHGLIVDNARLTASSPAWHHRRPHGALHTSIFTRC